MCFCELTEKKNVMLSGAYDVKCTGQMMDVSGEIVVFKDVCCFFVCVLLNSDVCQLGPQISNGRVCEQSTQVAVSVHMSVCYV